MVYLWRAVDAEGEVLDVLVQSRRDKRAALKPMRKLPKKYGFVPDRTIIDDLRSYGAAARWPPRRVIAPVNLTAPDRMLGFDFRQRRRTRAANSLHAPRDRDMVSALVILGESAKP